MFTIDNVTVPILEVPVQCLNENCEGSNMVWQKMIIKLNEGHNIIHPVCPVCGADVGIETFIVIRK